MQGTTVGRAQSMRVWGPSLGIRRCPLQRVFFLLADVLLCVSLAVLKVLQHSLQPVNASEFQVWDCTVIYKVMNPAYHSQ